MPLVRIDLSSTALPKLRQTVSDVVYDAMITVAKVPADELGERGAAQDDAENDQDPTDRMARLGLDGLGTGGQRGAAHGASLLVGGSGCR